LKVNTLVIDVLIQSGFLLRKVEKWEIGCSFGKQDNGMLTDPKWD